MKQSRRAIPTMVNHPERGRSLLWVGPEVRHLVYTNMWVPDESHPLGGYAGTVVLYRRVNLRKDEVPRSCPCPPKYEFTKEPRS